MKSTQQITKAMKQVAGAKIRRAEQMRLQSRPYAEALETTLHDLMVVAGRIDHPFVRITHPDAPRAVVLLTADKGLAGAFNANLIRQAEHLHRTEQRLVWYPIGLKGRHAVRRFGGDTIETWALSQNDRLATARSCAQRLGDDLSHGRISGVTIVGPKLISTIVQRPQVRELLPLQTEPQSPGKPHGAFTFEPSPEVVLEHLLPRYLEFSLYAAILETDAAFYAAQLVAMSNATDNAGKLIDHLTIVMNNARQAAITKEILEIVGGAEALTQ